MTAIHETPTDKTILTNLDQFKKWFKSQDFYTSLVFVHGDHLFDFELPENSFRVLAVQTAWYSWRVQQKQDNDLQSNIPQVVDLIESIVARSLNDSDLQEICGQILDLLEV